MLDVPVATVQIADGGKAIWVHDSQGSTVLRIRCTGKVVLRYGCENNCPHSDINVVGDIEVCVPGDASRDDEAVLSNVEPEILE